MEDENRKARRAARKEYNEAIRELVGFVKKRDKRMARVSGCCSGCVCVWSVFLCAVSHE